MLDNVLAREADAETRRRAAEAAREQARKEAETALKELVDARRRVEEMQGGKCYVYTDTLTHTHLYTYKHKLMHLHIHTYTYTAVDHAQSSAKSVLESGAKKDSKVASLQLELRELDNQLIDQKKITVDAQKRIIELQADCDEQGATVLQSKQISTTLKIENEGV